MSNLSISRFHTLFHGITGLPPGAFIAREKLKAAKELLRKSDKTVDEISAETGFCDRHHFGKMFKRMFGLPPAEYRRSGSIV